MLVIIDELIKVTAITARLVNSYEQTPVEKAPEITAGKKLLAIAASAIINKENVNTFPIYNNIVDFLRTCGEPVDDRN